MSSPVNCTVYYEKKIKDFNVMGLCGIEHAVSSLAWDWRRATVEPPKIMSGEGAGALGLMKRF